MAKPVRNRTRRRIPCELNFGGSRYSGLVLDLSPTGLFIQTSAKLRHGDWVDVEVRLPGEKQPVPLAAQVVRRKAVPPRLLTVAQGGVGLRIRSAPESYFVYLAEIAPETLEGGDLPPHARLLGDADSGGAQTAYRVQMRQVAGSRSRTVLVAGGSEGEAERRALSELGDGWKVLRVEKA